MSQDYGGLWLVGSQQGNSNAPDFSFYKSPDGGRTWVEDLQLGSGSLLFARLFDAQEGLVMWAYQGGEPLLFVTHDGGRHWIKRQSQILPLPRSCQFPDATDGWCIGHGQTATEVWATTDGGVTWSAVGQLPQRPVPTDPAFFDGRDGWVGTGVTGSGERLLLYRTQDGGRSWTPIELTPPSTGYPGFGAQLGPMEQLDTGLLATVLMVNEGSMGVGSPMAYYAYSSKDDGKTWSGPSLLWSGQVAFTGRPRILLLSPNRWLVATGPNVLMSRDAGHSWSRVALPLPAGYSVTVAAQGFRDGPYLVAQPPNCSQMSCSLLLGSDDAGATWSVRASSPAFAPGLQPPDTRGHGH